MIRFESNDNSNNKPKSFESALFEAFKIVAKSNVEALTQSFKDANRNDAIAYNVACLSRGFDNSMDEAYSHIS